MKQKNLFAEMNLGSETTHRLCCCSADVVAAAAVGVVGGVDGVGGGGGDGGEDWPAAGHRD